jgi:Flp pilus assembly protein TadG
MSRSTLVATVAAAALVLAACTTDDEGDLAIDTPQETAEPGDPTGDLQGTVTDAEVQEDRTVTLTIDTGDGTEEHTASTAAYITTRSEAGGLQRSRLTSWLDNNDFDGGTEYSFVEFGGEITDIRE